MACKNRALGAYIDSGVILNLANYVPCSHMEYGMNSYIIGVLVYEKIPVLYSGELVFRAPGLLFGVFIFW